ncbi:ADP-glyceromanno-heptose 6-epimerase, partial [candidate division GN15 bacterium]|nr:ADP-glyceromanno-heptose 6-epimerase [candidate division GN15 bacterium]
TIHDYMDSEEFLEEVSSGLFEQPVTAILHQGACTDTMQNDGRYMMANNYTFSKYLLRFAMENQVPLVYASSGATYGAQRSFEEIPENERPINVYGYSKLAFDQHVRSVMADAESTIVGLRYFNVYGPRETQKGRMASMVYQLYRQLKKDGVCKLFEGTDGYGDGEQRRDFVSVDDVVKVNLHFAATRNVKGIVNVGTGHARSFNDVANAIIAVLGLGSIQYIPFPDSLVGKYQSFTQADLSSLRKLGYEGDFADLEEGVKRAIAGYEEFDRFA